MCLRFIIRFVLKLKNNPFLSFLHTCESAKAVQEQSECLDRKIRWFVIKLFAFVEIGYFVLGIQVVFLAEKEADEEKHFCYVLA